MKICKVCGNEFEKLHSKEMCKKCYNREWYKQKHNIKRTKKDGNKIIEYEDCAEMILYNNQCKEVTRTIIDLDDINKVKVFKWCLDGRGYVINRTVGKLHRFIMDCPDDKVVDHINHDKLNNRKSNLRICTKQQNNMNKGKTSTKATGVYWDKSVNKWTAQITINYKHKTLGSFNTKEEAVKARQEAEIRYFGEYRNQG